MPIELTKLEASTREAFYETLLTFWDQHWQQKFQQEFLAWRYAHRPDGETLVAMSGSRCVGLIDTFIRPYYIGGQKLRVREPCDWYCLPGNRGVGMRLLQFLMAQGEPLLGVGLPKGAVAIASRLKWTHLQDTHDFILPITARRVIAALLRKAKLGDGSIARYIPQKLRLRSSAAWMNYQEVDGEVHDIASEDWPAEDWPSGQASDRYAVAPILTKSYVRWLASGPTALGEVFCLAFRTKGLLVGLTICRIEASKVGRKARLIHLQSSKLNVKMLRWMIAENVYRAAQRGVESVICRSSCPTINAALTSLRFHHTAAAAVMVGFNDLPIPSGPINTTFVRGDDAMIPSLIAE